MEKGVLGPLRRISGLSITTASGCRGSDIGSDLRGVQQTSTQYRQTNRAVCIGKPATRPYWNNTMATAQEVMMVPTKDYANLVNYYKGRITESALLNKAGRLAAERHMILADPNIPDAMAMTMTKPKAKELSRLTKRIRIGGTTQGTTASVTGGSDDDDDDAMLVSPLENKLDKILRATEKTLKQQPQTPLVPPTKRRKLPLNNPSSRNRPRRVQKADGYPP